jgi:peptidoglycan/LPS O-acetylase OafA/YrhL
MQRIKILDSMRGMAATVIVFHHTYTRFSFLYIDKEPTRLHLIFTFISNLNVQAVLFFFILSGFSICLSLKKGLPITKVLFNEYVYRRLRRILPLYYFAIVFTFISGLITHAIYKNDDFSIKCLLGNVFFLQCSKSYNGNWFAPYGDNGPLWSLSFEMFYYFFFPVFILLLAKCLKENTISEKMNRIALTSTFLFSLGCMFINNYVFFPYIAFAALFYVWYCGFFIACLYLQERIVIKNDFFLIIIFIIASGALLYIKVSAGLYKLLSGSLIAAAFFIFYILRKKFQVFFVKYFDRVFNFLFNYVGKGSYALYLLHYPFIMILKSFYTINFSDIVISMVVLILFCTRLEQYLVKKKWLLFKKQYVGNGIF